MKLNSVGARLWGGFFLILVLVTIIVGMGWWRAQTMSHEINAVINTVMEKERLSLEWASNTTANGMRVMMMAESRNEERVKQIQAQIKQTTDNISQIQKRLTDLGASDEEAGMFALIAGMRMVYIDAREAVFKIKAGNEEEGLKFMQTSLEPALAEYTDQIKNMAKYHSERSLESSKKLMADFRDMQQWLLILGMAAVALSFFIAWRITLSVTRPLRRAVNVVNSMAVGDLTKRVDITSRDEIGQLLEALRNMSENMIGMVGNMLKSAQSITRVSRDIAAGNLDFSARTNSQSRALEGTATAMEEITATIRQAASRANDSDKLARIASDVAGKGGNVVSQVVATMESINGSSKKIVDIIAVIDGLAFQTNILALNAAVEAARAGEHGSGFAVVAAEVRSLAPRSATAAKEMQELIDDSVHTVNAGSTLVHQAGSTMEDVVQSIDRLAALIGEMTASNNEQARSIEQINDAIQEMDSITKENAALVQEGAASAQVLQGQAVDLETTASVFKLGQARPASGQARDAQEEGQADEVV
jgi:methyl-accepting chemotaxis protein